jgi:tetratricopeptide (TPR) repeat protein
VDAREIKSEERATPGETSADQPLVLIPMTADDVARGKRRKVLIGLAIGLVVLLAGAFVYRRFADPRDAREAYDAGLRLMKATRYEQAALNFTRAVDLKPDFIDAYRMRARVYVAEYNPDPAVRDFSRVLDLNPNDPSALVERGFAFLDKKDYPTAIADAGRAIALQPEFGRAYTLRATALRAMGDAGRAVQDFTLAVQLDPNLENYFQRASTYQTMGEHKLAIADFTSALIYRPEEPHIYFARAQEKAALGDSNGAREDIAAGRKIDGW